MMHIFERAFSRPNCRHPRCNAWWRLRNEACFQTPQCHHRNTPDTPLRQCLAYKSFHRDHFPFLKDWKPLGMISVEWENPRTCFTPIDWRFTIKLMERTQRKMEWNGSAQCLKPHPTIWMVGLVEIGWMCTVTGRLSVELKPNAQNHSCICQLSRCCARFNPPQNTIYLGQQAQAVCNAQPEVSVLL